MQLLQAVLHCCQCLLSLCVALQDHVLSLMDGSGEAYTAKSKPHFTCMASSGSGHVVVGSEDGKVRLFSSKTLKPVSATHGWAQPCVPGQLSEASSGCAAIAMGAQQL